MLFLCLTSFTLYHTCPPDKLRLFFHKRTRYYYPLGIELPNMQQTVEPRMALFTHFTITHTFIVIKQKSLRFKE